MFVTGRSRSIGKTLALCLASEESKEIGMNRIASKFIFSEMTETMPGQILDVWLMNISLK